MKAVIFDFDGVIADTEKLHYLAFERVLEPKGLGMTWEGYVEACIGFDDRDVFRYRYQHDPGHLDGGVLDTYLAEKAQAFLDLVADLGAPIYDGVESLIARLQEANVPIAVCSGAVRSDIEAVLQATSFADAFPVQITADDVAQSKPDPECYRLTTATLLPDLPVADYEQVIAIEDTPTGLAAAVGAGLTAVAITNTHPAAALHQATRVFQSAADLDLAAFAAALPRAGG